MTTTRKFLVAALLVLGLLQPMRGFVLLLESDKPAAGDAPAAASLEAQAEAAAKAAEEAAEKAEAAAEAALEGIPPPPPAPASSHGEEPKEPSEPEEPTPDEHGHPGHFGQRDPRDSVVLTVMQDAIVPADQTVQQATAFRGNVLVDGHVEEATIAFAGNTIVNGSSGGPIISFFGDISLNGRAQHEVISIMGDVNLSPTAFVGGQAIVIGGTLNRAPGAQVRGEVINVAIAKGKPDLRAIQAWVREAVFMARPLAPNTETAWAWWIAAAFLAFYVVLSLIAPGAVQRCVDTLEERPGRTLIATALSAFLVPLVFVLLLVTIIGSPIFGLFVMACAVFGKTAFLLWAGRRFGIRVPALAVLAGGIVLCLLYLIPVVGLLMFMLSTALGIGMAVYTVILLTRRERKPDTPAPASAVPPNPFVAPAAAEPVSSVSTTAYEAQSASQSAPPLPSVDPIQPPPPPVPPVSTPAASDVDDVATARRAGFRIRLGASLIDMVAVSIIISIIHLQGFFALLLTVYCVTLWVLRGATLGGIICGLRVVRLDSQPMDWTTGVVRALGGFISLAVAGLGFIWVTFDDEKQSWHDRIAGTTIIYTRSRRGLV